jgi:hypothetical protein
MRSQRAGESWLPVTASSPPQSALAWVTYPANPHAARTGSSGYQRLTAGDRLQVHIGAKRLVTRTREDDRPDAVIVFVFFQGVAEADGDGEVDRVADIRAIQRDQEDMPRRSVSTGGLFACGS